MCNYTSLQQQKKEFHVFGSLKISMDWMRSMVQNDFDIPGLLAFR